MKTDPFAVSFITLVAATSACAQMEEISTPSNSVAAPLAISWSPLKAASFFQELTEPWVPVPDGPSGAPRQGWLNTDDGFFTREVHLAYDYTDLNGGEANEALFRLNLPISRRLWVGFTEPFYQRTRLSGGSNVEGVGDGVLTTEVMLAESRDFSLNAGLGWRLPWGSPRVGGGVFGATPQINVWKDIGDGVSLRGGIAYEVLDSPTQPNDFLLNAAIGQTITSRATGFFGDFTYYIAANYHAPSSGPGFFSLTPGLRSRIGGNLFLLTGVEVPLANRNQTFSTKVFAQLVQGF
jgi:hypothetical protein